MLLDLLVYLNVAAEKTAGEMRRAMIVRELFGGKRFDKLLSAAVKTPIKRTTSDQAVALSPEAEIKHWQPDGAILLPNLVDICE